MLVHIVVWIFVGYNEEDFEKPKFKGRTPSAAKVTFKLSSSANDRQVEVHINIDKSTI